GGGFVLWRGRSGSGKTTVLALLGGLERPTRGEVLFDGRELGGCSGVELARLRRRVGFVFQDFGLIPGLPAWENLTYPLIPRGVGRAERRRLAEEWLGRGGPGGPAQGPARRLSRGGAPRPGGARAPAPPPGPAP